MMDFREYQDNLLYGVLADQEALWQKVPAVSQVDFMTEPRRV